MYEPGQAPQPYVAPAAPIAASAAPVAAAQATAPTQPVTGQVPPAFGGPRPGETQPTAPVAGVPPYGTQPGQPAVAGQPAPKQRRVGLGVAAAIVAAALIGGASGAGITALISSNQAPASSDSADSAQNIVVNDTDSVNQITAVAAKASPSVVTISVTGSQAGGTGSGIILSEDGYVLTNTHVVTLDGATGDPTIQVKTNDGHLYTAELVGTDPLSDLAVIKLTDASGLTPLEFADSDKLNVGDTAIAIGAPLGLSGTVTNGIISALNRWIDVASSAAPTTPDDSTEGDSGQGDTGEGDGSEQSPFDFFFDLPNPDGDAAAAAAVRCVGPGVAAGHPDGCRHQPRQLGRRAARLRGQAHRRQRRDPLGRRLEHRGRQHRRRLRGPVEPRRAHRERDHRERRGHPRPARRDGHVRRGRRPERHRSAPSSPRSAPAARPSRPASQAGDVVTEFNGVPITDQTDLTAQVRALPGGEEADVTFTRDGESQTVTVTLGTFEG